MSGSVSVEADPAWTGGYAIIRLHGAARYGGSVAFRLRRNDYDEGVLGPHGWQVADHLLMPDSKTVEGNDLVLHVGPSVVQMVESGVYHFSVPEAGFETSVTWPDLPLLPDAPMNMVAEPPRAAVRSASVQRPEIHRTQAEPPPVTPPTGQRVAPTVEQRAPPPATQPDPAGETVVQRPPPADTLPPGRIRLPPDTEPTGKPAWLWAVLAVVALLVVGGGGWYGYGVLFPPDEPPAPPTPQPQPQPQPQPEAQTHPPPTPQPPTPQPPTPAPAGPDLTHMSAADAIRSGAPPEALLAEAQRRMQLDAAQRSDALLLMQAAADRNYAPAHAALGRLYDPGLPHPPEIQPNARQAALHYRLAAQGGDPDVAAPRAALKTWLELQAQRNDLYAPLILKDFWP